MSSTSSSTVVYPTGETCVVRKTPEATLTIGVVWKRPNGRLLLARLREWATQQAASKRLPFGLAVQSLPSVAEALDWRAGAPATRLIVAAGFGGNELGPLQIDTSKHEPVLAMPSDSPARSVLSSATFLNVPSVFECDQDTLFMQLRKSILRIVLRSRIAIRPPLSDEELSEYFALRYRIWESVGFLRSASSMLSSAFMRHLPRETDARACRQALRSYDISRARRTIERLTAICAAGTLGLFSAVATTGQGSRSSMRAMIASRWSGFRRSSAASYRSIS
jgi:hypothetical protein